MFEEARAERDFRQNPPESAPGQKPDDDGWGDIGVGSSSVDTSQPNYDSNINEVLNKPDGQPNAQNPNMMQQGTSAEDKIIDLSIYAGKGVFKYFSLLAKSLKNNTKGDWHNLGVRITWVSLGISGLGFLFMPLGRLMHFNGSTFNLTVGGILSLMCGVALCTFFDKENSEGVEEPEVSESTSTESSDVDWASVLADDTEEEENNSYEDSPSMSNESLWESILEDDIEDEDEYISNSNSVDSDDFDVDDAISSMPEIDRGTQTRRYLFETFSKVLPLVNPSFSVMEEISIESDKFFEFEDYLRGAAYQVGTKEENIPELESLYENAFVYRLNCTRPVGLKEQLIADEIANTFSRDNNNRQVRFGTYATVETSVGKYTVNVFKGFEKDALGQQVGGVKISLGDIYKQIEDFVCSPNIDIPFVWGVNEFGGVLYCDMKDNNSIIISGEPRGGKSWKGQSFVAQVAMFHSPKEVEFYIFDGKDNASDYKYLSTVLPHVKYFCGDMDKINSGISRVLDKMLEERGRIITEAGCINIKDYNATHPDSKLPYTYIIIDELMSLRNHFVETDQKEEGAKFKSYLSTMVSKLPYTGIKFVLFPHRIVNDVISKNTYSLVSCRAVVNQTNMEELKSAVNVTEKNFPYKLAQKGDMALKIKEIAGGDTVFCHAEMLSSSNQNNMKLFDYIGAVWRKLEPDCTCIEMHGMIGGSIDIDRGVEKKFKSANFTPKDNTNGAKEYEYSGYSDISDALSDMDTGELSDDEEAFWQEFLNSEE